MTTIEIIKRLKATTFSDQDEDSYNLDFKRGLTEDELEILRTKFPSNRIDDELLEILRETKGWEGYGLEITYFDSIDEFGFTDLIPHSITLGHDGLGNFWLLDINDNGDLGKVYFVCHDPAVLAIYSDTLHEFFISIEEFYNNPDSNYLDDFHEKLLMDIWSKKPNTFDIDIFRKNNIELNSFINEFTDDNWIVADLRQGKTKDGFAWGQLGYNQLIKRHPKELIWLIQKRKKGFLSKLFGK